MAAIAQAQSAEWVGIHPAVVRITHWINVVAVVLHGGERMADLQRVAALRLHISRPS